MKMTALSMVWMIVATAAPGAQAGEPLSAQTFATYCDVAGFEKQYHQMVNIFVSNLQQGMIRGFEHSLEERRLPEDVRKEMRPLVVQASENIKTRFEQVFRREVDFQALLQHVYLPVYQKYFDEQEMAALIAFYASPVGKKLSAVTPVLMQESSASFNRRYGARVQKIGGELVSQELEDLMEKLHALEGDRHSTGVQ